MWIAAVGGVAGVLWLLPSRMSTLRDVSEEGLAFDPARSDEAEDAARVPVEV
jgi:hypothetical protein